MQQVLWGRKVRKGKKGVWAKLVGEGEAGSKELTGREEDWGK